MRKLGLSLILIASLDAVGQTTSSGRKMELNSIVSLVAQKATVTEVIQKLGDPAELSAGTGQAVMQYKWGENLYLLRFDNDKKLRSFIFVDHSKSQAGKLSYETVKQTRNARTKQDISSSFGQPVKITVNDKEESWYYIFEEKETQNTLVVHFDLSGTDLVQRYNFTVDCSKMAAITAADINNLVVGSTSTGDVQKWLGSPSQILLDNELERWQYLSQNATLVVYFDKQSKLIDYVSQQKAE